MWCNLILNSRKSLIPIKWIRIAIELLQFKDRKILLCISFFPIFDFSVLTHSKTNNNLFKI